MSRSAAAPYSGSMLFAFLQNFPALDPIHPLRDVATGGKREEIDEFDGHQL